MPRPPSWAIKNTINRVDYNDPKYTSSLITFYQDADLFALSIPLRHNTKIEVINFQNCRVGDEASRGLRDAFYENEVLEEICFTSCVIGSKKFKRLLQGISG